MTTLDYAAYFENHVRPRQRQRRRLLLGLAAVLVSAVPLALVGFSGVG